MAEIGPYSPIDTQAPPARIKAAAQWAKYQPRRLRALAVLQAFCERHGVTVQAIRSQARERGLVLIRQAAYAHVRAEARVGRVILGDVFNRDRQTIWHGVRAHEKRAGGMSGQQD